MNHIEENTQYTLKNGDIVTFTRSNFPEFSRFPWFSSSFELKFYTNDGKIYMDDSSVFDIDWDISPEQKNVTIIRSNLIQALSLSLSNQYVNENSAFAQGIRDVLADLVLGKNLIVKD